MAKNRYEYLHRPGNIQPSIRFGPLRAPDYNNPQGQRLALFDIALDDLAAAILLTANELGAQAAFLAGEAAENILKACLLAIGTEIVRTHSVAKLVEVLLKQAPDQVRERNYLGHHLILLARELDATIGSANTLTRYPRYTARNLTYVQGEHPVIFFGNWAIYDVLETAATVVNWALYQVRLLDPKHGIRARQQCARCSGDWRPIYCCSSCLRWVCEEHSLLGKLSGSSGVRTERLCDECFTFISYES